MPSLERPSPSEFLCVFTCNKEELPCSQCGSSWHATVPQVVTVLCVSDKRAFDLSVVCCRFDMYRIMQHLHGQIFGFCFCGLGCLLLSNVQLAHYAISHLRLDSYERYSFLLVCCVDPFLHQEHMAMTEIADGRLDPAADNQPCDLAET